MKRSELHLALASASLFALCALPAIADNPTSSGGNVVVLPGEPGASGGQISGGTITAETSTGDTVAGGVSNVPGFQAKGGYTGQLYDATAVVVSASPASVDENGTRQLAVAAVMDDATTLALAVTDVAWSVVDGPLTGIDTNGLATAGSVFENTAATARGSYSGIDGDLALTVLNSNTDNFGSYAGDGIDDDWQVSFFGLDNPNAAPGIDADGDDQDNLYEFLAKVDPTDRTSFFSTSLERNPSDPDKRDIILNPVFADRTYNLLVSPDLTPANFVPATNTTTSDSGNERTITDHDPTTTRQFYKVQISRP